MKKSSEDFLLLKQPSAWIPIAISLASLAGIMAYVAIFGITQNEATDEGAPARIFQCVMTGQLLIIAYFALKWLPKRPIQALFILALQAVSWITPILTIIWLENL